MYKVDVTQSGAAFGNRAPDIIKQGLVAAMMEAVALLERSVKMKTPTGVFGAQGGLLAGIHGEVVNVGGAGVKGLVGHQSPYGDVIELGRRPGQKWPPAGVLLRWIEKKITQWEGGKWKGRESSAAGLEFVIRRKIGVKGFEGAKMFEKALAENWPKIEEIFGRAGFDISRQLGGGGAG